MAAVERFGFTGGRILEPAAGIGHFIGAMPRNLAERSNITAVEIDCPGRILNAPTAPGGRTRFPVRENSAARPPVGPGDRQRPASA